MKAHEHPIHQCNIHPTKTLKYVCMDSNCSETVHGCEICVLRLHSKCKDEYLIRRDDINVKLVISNLNKYKTKADKILADIFDRQAVFLNKELRNAKKAILELYIDEIYTVTKKNDLGVINKTEYEIVHNIKTNKIEISFLKSKVAQKNIDETIEKTLNAENQKFIRLLNELSISTTAEMELDNWQIFPNSQLNLAGSNFRLLHKNSKNAFGEGGCVYKTPLIACDIKFSVFSNNEEYAKIRIGLVDFEGFTKAQKTKRISDIVLAALDYQTTYQLTGKKNMENSLEKTFLNGNDILMKFRRDEVIFQSVQHSSSFSAVLDPKIQYYLFVSVVEKDNWCDICFLE